MNYKGCGTGMTNKYCPAGNGDCRHVGVDKPPNQVVRCDFDPSITGEYSGGWISCPHCGPIPEQNTAAQRDALAQALEACVDHVTIREIADEARAALALAKESK